MTVDFRACRRPLKPKQLVRQTRSPDLSSSRDRPSDRLKSVTEFPRIYAMLALARSKRATRVASSVVEHSAFNRLVPGSNPGQPFK